MNASSTDEISSVVVVRPVFSIASFMGGMAMKDWGPYMQLTGCIIGSVAIFLPSALLVLFFFPIWHNIKKYATVYRALEGINAVIVGIMFAATFYMMRDISIVKINTNSIPWINSLTRMLPQNLISLVLEQLP